MKIIPLVQIVLAATLVTTLASCAGGGSVRTSGSTSTGVSAGGSVGASTSIGGSTSARTRVRAGY